MGLLFYLRCDRTDETSNWTVRSSMGVSYPLPLHRAMGKEGRIEAFIDSCESVALVESSVQRETYLFVEALEPSQSLIFLRWDSDFQSFHFSLLAFLLLPSNLFLGLGYVTSNVNLYKQLTAILWCTWAHSSASKLVVINVQGLGESQDILKSWCIQVTLGQQCQHCFMENFLRPENYEQRKGVLG